MPLKETKRPKRDPQQNTLFLAAGDSGDFGDAERHAPKPYCTARSLERANERPGIWRPQRRIHYMCGAWSNVSALPLKETKRPKQDPQQNTLFLTAGGSGDFGDAERHAPKPYCTARSLERANERPGIWRPQRRIHYMCGAWSNVSALPLKETKRPEAGPA